MRSSWRYLIVAALLLSACKPEVPKQYIQPDDMEDLLYDYYVGQGMSNVKHYGPNDYQRQLYFGAVLKKYGVTREEFDSSLVYYYTRADRFVKIYENVQKRLADEALALGASDGEVGRFTQSLSGDTANVWEGMRYALLMPQAPYNMIQFTQKADTTFRPGDSFMLALKSNFLVQSGSKMASAYLSVTYENDSVISQHISLSSVGSNQLRIPVCDSRAKEFRGMFYMNRRLESDNTSDMAALFIDQISLIRFHRSSDAEKEKTPVHSDTASVGTKTDSVAVPPTRRRLGERPLPVSVQEPPPGPQNIRPSKPIKPTNR